MEAQTQINEFEPDLSGRMCPSGLSWYSKILCVYHVRCRYRHGSLCHAIMSCAGIITDHLSLTFLYRVHKIPVPYAVCVLPFFSPVGRLLVSPACGSENPLCS